MRVLVCGSRTFPDATVVAMALFGSFALSGDDPDRIVIEGQCPYGGADAHAEDWARNFATEHLPFPAEIRNGRIQGPQRNQRMLDEGKPDVVWAFVDKPLAESRGTADMVRRARAAGIPTYVVEAVPVPLPVPTDEGADER